MEWKQGQYVFISTGYNDVPDSVVPIAKVKTGDRKGLAVVFGRSYTAPDHNGIGLAIDGNGCIRFIDEDALHTFVKKVLGNGEKHKVINDNE